jgi:hypothetical protein
VPCEQFYRWHREARDTNSSPSAHCTSLNFQIELAECTSNGHIKRTPIVELSADERCTKITAVSRARETFHVPAGLGESAYRTERGYQIPNRAVALQPCMRVQETCKAVMLMFFQGRRILYKYHKCTACLLLLLKM